VAQLKMARRTARLILRRFELSDLDELAELYADADVCRYLYWEPRNKEQTLEMLERKIARSDDHEIENVLPVAVALGDTNQLIGDFLLRWKADEHSQGEVGGSLLPQHQGRGYAVEIYAELLHIGFEKANLHRIVGRCDARNVASIRSLEKAGLHQEAHLIENEFVKGEWTDEVILALRRSEWLARIRKSNG
jgi:RimJ/RimL family protein N-acetyltransferase